MLWVFPMDLCLYHLALCRIIGLLVAIQFAMVWGLVSSSISWILSDRNWSTGRIFFSYSHSFLIVLMCLSSSFLFCSFCVFACTSEFRCSHSSMLWVINTCTTLAAHRKVARVFPVSKFGRSLAYLPFHIYCPVNTRLHPITACDMIAVWYLSSYFM